MSSKFFDGNHLIIMIHTPIFPAVILLLFSLIISSFPQQVMAEQDAAAEPQTMTLEYEFDAYYSNIGIYKSLTDKPIPHAGEKHEMEIYRDLFISSYVPRFLVLEVSVNPLPCLGLLIKNNYPDFYTDADLSENLNLIESVTAGFEEPYALSLFLGNVVSFAKPGKTSSDSNKGYMGYLLSVGNYHIKKNEAISDNWIELEWKVKGDRRNKRQNLSWSFRAGAKIHGNDYISDVFYFSMRRSRIDYQDTIMSIFKNSGIEYIFEFDAKTFEIVQHTIFVSKKVPYKNTVAFTVDVGFIWESNTKYSGPLRDAVDDSGYTFLFRPNLVF